MPPLPELLSKLDELPSVLGTVCEPRKTHDGKPYQYFKTYLDSREFERDGRTGEIKHGELNDASRLIESYGIAPPTLTASRNSYYEWNIYE